MADLPTASPGIIRMASVDWLTATARSDFGRAEFQRLAAVIGRPLAGLGNAVKPWTWQGYIGSQCGELTWGERRDGAILRLSGPLAADHWRRVSAAASNISRLDLQVTVFHNPFPDHLAYQGYHQLLALYPTEDERPNFDCRLNSHGGETLYLGRGASDKYARLYNKAKESPDPAYRDCWRYEVELKGQAAALASRRLMSSDAETAQVIAYVWRHFNDRSVAPTFANASPNGLLSVPRARSTDERRLSWLTLQVRACVQQLVAKGRMQDVRAALGL